MAKLIKYELRKLSIILSAVPASVIEERLDAYLMTPT